VVKLNKQNYQN